MEYIKKMTQASNEDFDNLVKFMQGLDEKLTYSDSYSSVGEWVFKNYYLAGAWRDVLKDSDG